MYLNQGVILSDRYQIIQELGRGGWGVTYLARDIELPNKPNCVIKEITPSPYLTAKQNEILFEKEASVLHILGKHPQIPRLFARFKQDGKFYLIQEYIIGNTLEQKLRERNTFTELEAIGILKDILLILQVVHRHKYIHRDIKPSNLICSQENNQIFLIDFGSVKELSSKEYTNNGEYKSTVVIGTHGYMPAEQIAKNSQYNTDIYALGITIIRLLTGLNAPITSENNYENNNRMLIDSSNGEVIWYKIPPLVEAININPKLAAILSKMVRYSFCDRYQSTEEVLKDLEELDESIPETETIPSPLSDKQIPWIKLLVAGFCGLFAGISLIKILPIITAPKTEDYKIDFTKVCNDPLIKGKEFANYQGVPEFVILKSSQPIWSVFNWKCVFNYQGDTQIRGIDLDEYCLAKYKDSGYRYEAYFKNYLDKNSWYCTSVGTKFDNSPLAIDNFSSLRGDHISSGEEMLHSNLPLQQQATELFTAQKYQEAAGMFLQSWQEEGKHPQTLIYLNNTLLELSGKEYYTIAITVPISSNVLDDSGVRNIDLANEMLRGVAQAQTQVNLGINLDRLPGKNYLQPKTINGKGLKIIVADDGNDLQQAQNIANKLIARSEILGVVGNYASDMTTATIDLFNNNKTTLISPGSTSEELTQPHREFFFRTIPTVTDTGEALANYLINERKLKQAAIFYNPESPYTRSIKKEFKQVFQAKGGNVPLEYDRLHQSSFDVTQALKAVEQQEDIAIVLFPDGQVTHAVNNSLEIINQNNGKHWIVAGATVYHAKTLKIGRIKALEKLVVAVPWHPLSSRELPNTDTLGGTVWASKFIRNSNNS